MQFVTQSQRYEEKDLKFSKIHKEALFTLHSHTLLSFAASLKSALTAEL